MEETANTRDEVAVINRALCSQVNKLLAQVDKLLHWNETKDAKLYFRYYIWSMVHQYACLHCVASVEEHTS